MQNKRTNIAVCELHLLKPPILCVPHTYTPCNVPIEFDLFFSWRNTNCTISALTSYLFRYFPYFFFSILCFNFCFQWGQTTRISRLVSHTNQIESTRYKKKKSKLHKSKHANGTHLRKKDRTIDKSIRKFNVSF